MVQTVVVEGATVEMAALGGAMGATGAMVVMALTAAIAVMAVMVAMAVAMAVATVEMGLEVEVGVEAALVEVEVLLPLSPSFCRRHRRPTLIWGRAVEETVRSVAFA